MPILDPGETDDYFVGRVAARASKSLEAEVEAAAGKLDEASVRSILVDVATALTDLAQRQVVHRDIKPPNVLWLDLAWCSRTSASLSLSDVTTAKYTWKMAGSSPYVAPERWRMERATSASDVYSLGVLAYEILAGGDLPSARTRH